MARVCSSMSGAAAAWTPPLKNPSNKIRIMRKAIVLTHGLKFASSFFNADETLLGFEQLFSHHRGADTANMFVGDAPLGIDEETLRNAPNTVIDGNPAGVVLAVGIRHRELV